MNIFKFIKTPVNNSYLAISLLGKNLKLNIKYTNRSDIELEKKEIEINLFLPKSYKNSENIDIINLAIKKLYDEIANVEIEYAMEIARHILRFAPENYKIERLNGLFYKCKGKIITVNPDIVQYNREVINTTIIQAFCKIKHNPNSSAYKETLKYAMEKYYEYKQKQNNNQKILKIS